MQDLYAIGLIFGASIIGTATAFACLAALAGVGFVIDLVLTTLTGVST